MNDEEEEELNLNLFLFSLLKISLIAAFLRTPSYRFDDSVRALQAKGVQAWPSPDVMEFADRTNSITISKEKENHSNVFAKFQQRFLKISVTF